MKFDSRKHFKFTMLEDMEDLVGRTIKSFHEDNNDDYYAFLTEDNEILAFTTKKDSYGNYAYIETMDDYDLSYSMNKGRIDDFYKINELIDEESFKEDYQAAIKAKEKAYEDAQIQKEYQQYLNLKNKFENK